MQQSIWRINEKIQFANNRLIWDLNSKLRRCCWLAAFCSRIGGPIGQIVDESKTLEMWVTRNQTALIV